MIEAPMDDEGVLPVYSDALHTAPGWFQTKLCKGGCFVPCRLRRVEERDEVGDLMSDVLYLADIDGTAAPAEAPPGWPWKRITKADWRFMTDKAAWCRANDPDAPEANPRRPASHSEPRFY